MKKIILFAYLPLALFTVMCSNQKKNEKEELVVLFKEFVNELVYLRQSYNARVDSIQTVEIGDISYIKDIPKIEKIKSTINQQRLVDNWNYSKNENLFSNWKEKFDSTFQNSADEEIQSFLKVLNDSYSEVNETRNKMSELESNYLSSYEKYLDFLIENNNRIKLENGNIVIDTQHILTEYNIVLKNYIKNESAFHEYAKDRKNVLSNQIIKINSELNIQEVNNAIEVMK